MISKKRTYWLLGWCIDRAAPVSCQTERQQFFSHESNITFKFHIILFLFINFLFDTPSPVNNKACIGFYFHNHLKQIQSYEHCIHKFISPKIVRYLRFSIFFKFKTDIDRTITKNGQVPVSRCRHLHNLGKYQTQVFWLCPRRVPEVRPQMNSVYKLAQQSYDILAFYHWEPWYTKLYRSTARQHASWR